MTDLSTTWWLKPKIIYFACKSEIWAGLGEDSLPVLHVASVWVAQMACLRCLGHVPGKLVGDVDLSWLLARDHDSSPLG